MERPTIIEIARKARGWTQTQLAKAAGTSQATVSAYERREKSPSLGVIERLVGEAGYALRLDHTVDLSSSTTARPSTGFPTVYGASSRDCASAR